MNRSPVLKSASEPSEGIADSALPSDESLPEPQFADTTIRAGNRREGNGWLYPAALAVSTLVLGFASIVAPVAGVIAAVGAGALCVLRKRFHALGVAALMLGALAFLPPAGFSSAYWMLIALSLVAAAAPLRIAPSLLRVAPMTWAVCLVICAASIGGLLLEHGTLLHFFIFAGCVSSFLLGAGLARHLAMVDARILAWGEEGLTAVTRDLLLGRITSGMLHDLSQPLNVISMANGNLGYIAEHLDTDDATRQQLLERTARIATHTESAASILTLFRWFGRSAYQDGATLTVRSALSRAVQATRSNVRYHGVEVELDGNALDMFSARHHGRIEMMAVAALLSALSAYGSSDGERTKGRIVLFASGAQDEIVVEVHCFDTEGEPVQCKPLDNATLWLIEQVAHEAQGEFRSLTHRNDQVQFVFRFERND